MKLYHGSKNGGLTSIKKMQAQTGEGVDVPEDELKEGIYLTPHFEYALAMAIRPNGVTYIDDQNKTIEFENPELFFPDREVYVYEVDVSDHDARKIDENQYVIENMDEIKPTTTSVHKAIEIENYYRLKNWKRELGRELGGVLKMR